MEGYSKDGRKLRPRMGSTSSTSEKVDYSERRSSYGDRPRQNNGEHRSYGERRSYGSGRSNFSGNGESRSNGERRSYGENRGGNYGERRSYGDKPRQYGERKSYGERSNFSGNGEGRSNYGERKSYGENRGSNYGERRSYGDKPRQYGERKSYGERSNFSGNGEGRSNYGERKSYGENRGSNFGERRSNFGERRSGGYGQKPYGRSNGQGRKPYGQQHFGKQTEEGINKMISRRPVVNDSEYYDNEPVQTTPQNEMRLNKFIANSGVCSRREADTLIQAGVVTVNGEVVTELGTKVNIFDDDIRFNGERLKGEEKVYIIMNKPAGYVTTASDPHAEKTVMDLLKGCESRVYPVGRLDKATTGVLMFTNDGEIAERLTHPSYNKKKIYQVALDRALEKEDYDQILAGVTLTDGEVAADTLEYIDEGDKRKLGIEIHSGKNRIVRRIFESLGYTVKALDRVYFAGLTKKGLKKGEWRKLTEAEVNILKMGAYV